MYKTTYNKEGNKDKYTHLYNGYLKRNLIITLEMFYTRLHPPPQPSPDYPNSLNKMCLITLLQKVRNMILTRPGSPSDIVPSQVSPSSTPYTIGSSTFVL